MLTVGEFISAIGFVFLFFGIIGQYRYRAFFKKLLVSSLVDSAALILIFTGLILRQGFNTFSLKIFAILVITLLVNTLSSHKLGRSAYLCELGDDK